MTDCITAWVSTDVPGLRELDYSTGGAYTTATVASGWQSYEDYLDAITSALGTAGVDYAAAYDPTTDRVTLTRQSGAQYKIRLESQSMADLLGCSSTTAWDALADTHTGDVAPDGAVPVSSVDLRDPTPSRQIEPQAFAWRRDYSIAFGDGVEHRVELRASYAAAQRILSGPCGRGRVRVGPYPSTAAYSSTALSGTVDGEWSRLRAPALVSTTETWIAVTGTLRQTRDPDATSSEWDAVFGSLDRGYSVVAYAVIEGLPLRLSASALGWTDSDRTEHARLILDGDGRISYQIDRQSGVCGAGRMRLGILDPDDDTGVFAVSTLTTRLTADLDAADTTASADTTGWPSSGTFWVGKEYVEYSGTSGGTTFTGLTRGAVNPIYEYRAKAPNNWQTISNRPRWWAGRIVEVWVALVDPWGRPVGTAWDDAHCRQVWAGELVTLPTYVAGVWTLDAEHLVRRLTRPAGAEVTGRVVPWRFGIQTADGPLVSVPTDATVRVEYEHPTGPFSGSADIAITALNVTPEASPSGYRIAPIGEFVGQAIEEAKAAYDADGGPEENWRPLYQSTEVDADGVVRCRVRKIINAIGGGSATYRIGPIITASGDQHWCWKQPIVFTPTDLSENQGGVISGLFPLGLTGKTSRLVPIETDPAADVDWPSTGAVVIRGDDGPEVIQYALLHDGISLTGRTYLYEVDRAQLSTPAVNLYPGDLDAQSLQALSGTIGAQIATALESSGLALRGTYDTQSHGYGLDDDHVGEASLQALAMLVSQETAYPGDRSLEAHIGGFLAASGWCVVPTRTPGDQRLRLGIGRTVPIAATATYTLTDDDLALDRLPEVAELLPAPNVATFEAGEIDDLESRVYRVIHAEAARAEGAREESYRLPVTLSLMGHVILVMSAQSVMWLRSQLVAYRFHVGPTRDWLPGQVIDIDLTHPALRDPATGARGLSGQGAIVEVARSVVGQSASIVVLVRADDAQVAPLVPAVLVTDVDGSVLTVAETTYPDGRDLWEDSSDVLLYQAGVDGRYDTVQIAGISGADITVSSVPAWLTDAEISANGAIYMAYPASGATNITAHQAAHAHYADGSVWM